MISGQYRGSLMDSSLAMARSPGVVMKKDRGGSGTHCGQAMRLSRPDGSSASIGRGGRISGGMVALPEGPNLLFKRAPGYHGRVLTEAPTSPWPARSGRGWVARDGMPMGTTLTHEQFERARRLALGLAGIELVDRHRELLERRTGCLAMPDSVDTWLHAAEHGDPDACRRLIQLLTTNFTAFFRHPWHFHLAAEHALWAAHQRGPARLWSAAAATGEEPYSLALALIEVFRRDDPPVTILATDIDEAALAVARDATYDESAVTALPPVHHARFIDEPVVRGRRRLHPAVRRLVEFRQLNLTDVAWPIDGVFDVVFCRNVLMYLETGHRYAVLERIASLLRPGGLLLLDPSEHLGGATPLFVDRGNGAYTRRAAAGRASSLYRSSAR